MHDTLGQQTPNGEVGAGFDEYLFYLLTQVANRRSKDFAPALEALGISLSEWRALSVINRLDNCLMSELAEFTTVDRTTLTRTVDRLVAANLVERGTAASDRRQVVITLSPHGRDVFERAVEILKTYNARVLGGLSEEDLRTLRALLQRILMNIVREPDHFQQVLHFSR